MDRPRSSRVGGSLLGAALIALACGLWFAGIGAPAPSSVESRKSISTDHGFSLEAGEPQKKEGAADPQRAEAAVEPASAVGRALVRVSGRTLGPGGAALVGASVVVCVEDSHGRARELTMPSGPGGEFLFEVPAGGSARYVLSTSGNLGAFASIAGSDGTSEVVLRHKPMGEIRAFVLDERSLPVAGAHLIGRPLSAGAGLDDPGCAAIVATTLHDGSARVLVPWSEATTLHATSEAHGDGSAVLGLGADSCVIQLVRPSLHLLANPAPLLAGGPAASVEVVSFGQHESAAGDGLPCMLPLSSFVRGAAVESRSVGSGTLQVRLTGTPVLGVCAAPGEDPLAFCTFDLESGTYGPWRELEETRFTLMGAGQRVGDASVRITHESERGVFSIDPDARLTSEGDWEVDTGYLGLAGRASVELEVTGSERSRFIGSVDLVPGLQSVSVVPVPNRLVPVSVTVREEETDRLLAGRTITVTETKGNWQPWRAGFVTDARGQFTYWGDPDRDHEYRTAPARGGMEFVATRKLVDADRTPDGALAIALAVPAVDCLVTISLGDVDGPHRFGLANLDRAPKQTDLRLECTPASCQRAAWEELAMVVDGEPGAVRAKLSAGRYAAYLLPLMDGHRVIDLRLPEAVTSRSCRATVFEVRDEDELGVELVRALGPLGSGTPQAYIDIAGADGLLASDHSTCELWTGARGADGFIRPSERMDPDQYLVTGDRIAVACDSKLFALLRVGAEGALSQSIPLCLEPWLTERVDLGCTVTVLPADGAPFPAADVLECQVSTTRTTRAGEVLRGSQNSRWSISGIDLTSGYVIRGVAPGSSLSITVESNQGTYRAQSFATSARKRDSQCRVGLTTR